MNIPLWILIGWTCVCLWAGLRVGEGLSNEYIAKLAHMNCKQFEQWQKDYLKAEEKDR